MHIMMMTRDVPQTRPGDRRLVATLTATLIALGASIASLTPFVRAAHATVLARPAAVTAGAVTAGAVTAISVVDDHGATITLAHTPRRIIALAPSDAEVLYAVGAGGRVVGVSAATTYPAAAANKPVVVTTAGPNLERIVALRPDLLVAGNIDASYLPKLRTLHLPIMELDPTSVSGVLHDLTITGIVTGHSATAHTLVASLQARIAAVAARLTGVAARPRVYYEYYYDKTGGYTYGLHSIGDALIAMAGGDNIGRVGRTAYPTLSAEQIVGAQPQVIVLGDASSGTTVAAARARPGFSAIPAVRLGRVYPFDDSIVSSPGPRTVDALERLARLLHPEAFQR